MQQIKRGFTLIELLIVIIIIGMVYMLFISGIGKEPSAPPLHFEKLREHLLKLSDNTPARLTCHGESCGECTLATDGNRTLELELFHEKPKVFAYDRYGYLDEVRYDEETCFQYTIYDNLSSDNILVKKAERYYILYAYLKAGEVFATYDEAVERFDPMKNIYLDTNDYYFGRE